MHPITVSQGTDPSHPVRETEGEREGGRQRGKEREREEGGSWPGRGRRQSSVFNSTPYNSTYPFTASEDCL